jgi:predicted DNA-binding protein
MNADKSISTRLTRDDYKKVLDLANKEHRSISAYLRIIIKDHIKGKHLNRGHQK